MEIRFVFCSTGFTVVQFSCIIMKKRLGVETPTAGMKLVDDSATE